MWSVRVPVSDLPNQAAWQSLSGQPVELKGDHTVHNGENIWDRVAAIFPVAPISQARHENNLVTIESQATRIAAMTAALPVLEVYDA